MKFSFLAVCLAAMTVFSVPAMANPHEINSKIINDIKSFIDTDIVRMSIINQNEKYGDIGSKSILDLDKQWRSETKSDTKPLISSVLSNPLSSYLTRIQAHSIGLYSEMFVMDKNGLNVGQSNISSDFWQGDEAKFQDTYSKGVGAVFVDEPEYDKDLDIWRIQVNMSIADESNKHEIGAVTVEINLTELRRRSQ